MPNLLKKTVGYAISFFLIGMFATPVALAVDCDQDADGYIYITYNQMQEAVLDNLEYNDNGNYSPEEWQNWFNRYSTALKADPLIDAQLKCDNVNFKKGAEPMRCDQPSVAGNSGVFDSSRVSSLAGSKVNPGAFDAPNNGIDEDCDGGDGKFVSDTASGGQDIGGLVQRSISLLSKTVVAISIIIMIWGGILYATAAGDEQKTSKAKKAIIGAIIGLAVGLLAPTIVSYITASLA